MQNSQKKLVLLAQELVHSLESRWPDANVVFKLDMAKAYDRAPSRIRVSHLAYAEDLMIFTTTFRQNMELLRDFLRAYEQVSGQLINGLKSSFIVGCQVSSLQTQAVQYVLGYQLKHLPVMYLGVPLYKGNRKACLFDSIISRLRDMLQGWAITNLSHGGRLALIRSVLQATPLHLLHVIHPPTEGGLGVRSLADYVRAFSMKLWWRFRGKSSLWFCFFLARYLAWREAPSPAPAQGYLYYGAAGQGDKIVWTGSSMGDFSTKSAWEAIRQASPRRQLLADVWHRSLRTTILVFLWQFFQDRIPVDARMRQKGACGSTLLPFLGSASMIREPHSYGALLAIFYPIHSDLHIRTLIPFLILWFIWTQQNAAKYRGLPFSTNGIILEVQRHLRTLEANGAADHLAKEVASLQLTRVLHHNDITGVLRGILCLDRRGVPYLRRRAIYSPGITALRGVKAFSIGRMLKQLNATLLVLIPKIQLPKEVSGYRPISCCNVLYMVVVNKMKVILYKLIDPRQNDFVPSKSISAH
ncbi:UNVERIFIED_CONTAM: hypothetical protein Scaly_2192500 [Sesamum calycinum]|uniref:Reverse transcriptase zinc-binding domain-containing protein n=1 Tax=Sesamum calycinum TaxID=2727403 RepID=A0AAW2MMW6_9LAMI